ncbi:MAG: 30S ribosome-binding factor RbfA [Actinobacteria bacterium]|nr:30S ribosome-binding factor RbfA [Actinomycetota bacterium]
MSRRIDKVSSQLVREISDIVANELTDPRIGFVTFTHADVSPDFSHARIYFTVLGKEKEKKSTYFGLKSATGYLKHALMQRMKMKRVPELEFVYDESVDQSMKVYEKIIEVQRKRKDESGSRDSE